MRLLAHRSTCSIVRDTPKLPRRAALVELDGNLLEVFGEGWTDDQIWAALEFANRAYDTGFTRGEQMRANDIRRLLET